MPDRFNKKAQELLREANDNGGLTLRSLFDLQIAAHDEAVAITSNLAKVTDYRLKLLGSTLDEVEDDVGKLDCVLHPRKPGVDCNKVRDVNDDDMMHTKVMWWIGSKIGYIIVAALVTMVNIALNYIWFGHP